MSCVVFCKLVTSRHSGQVPATRGLFSPQGGREVFEKQRNKISPLSALHSEMVEPVFCIHLCWIICWCRFVCVNCPITPPTHGFSEWNGLGSRRVQFQWMIQGPCAQADLRGVVGCASPNVAINDILLHGTLTMHTHPASHSLDSLQKDKKRHAKDVRGKKRRIVQWRGVIRKAVNVIQRKLTVWKSSALVSSFDKHV